MPPGESLWFFVLIVLVTFGISFVSHDIGKYLQELIVIFLQNLPRSLCVLDGRPDHVGSAAEAGTKAG